jgi:hypothetical protein
LARVYFGAGKMVPRHSPKAMEAKPSRRARGHNHLIAIF